MNKKRFFCVDAHTCGNPVRVVAGGGPTLQGKTIMEKREEFLATHDWIRKSLMFEPRGHDMMSGSILYPPADPANDVKDQILRADARAKIALDPHLHRL